MTPKQEEKIRNKIDRIRKELAQDKKRWGGFHDDSRGLRYLPPELFIKIKDYKGGLRYLGWFDRTFPDDSGYPIFLFEWTLILYKTGKSKEAEKKAFQTYFANNYIINAFLGAEPASIKKEEGSNWESQELVSKLIYSKADPELEDFAKWLEDIKESDKFQKFVNQLLEIDIKLETEPVGPKRSALVKRMYNLIDEI